jgi:hypothetical protein
MLKKVFGAMLLFGLVLAMSTSVMASDGELVEFCAREALLRAEQDLSRARASRSGVDYGMIEAQQAKIAFLETAIEIGSPVYVATWVDMPEARSSGVIFQNGGTRTEAWVAQQGVLWFVDHLRVLQQNIVINRGEARTVTPLGTQVGGQTRTNVVLTHLHWTSSFDGSSSAAINRWSQSTFNLRQDGWDIVQRTVRSPFTFTLSETISE